MTARRPVGRDPWAFVRNYGPDWVASVVVDDVEAFVSAGGRLRDDMWAMVDGEAFPVVCGDIVLVHDADGFPMDGRCGVPIAARAGACAGHRAAALEYLNMSEAERMAWEREGERAGD